ncbi:unnamed protein product, partial [Lepidochelys kempii]
VFTVVNGGKFNLINCSSSLTKTASTGELEEHIAATTGAITVASTSADVTVSSVTAVTNHSLSEEPRVEAMNLRKSILEPTTSKEMLSLHQANIQSARRRPRNAEQIERTKELAVVTHRGIGYYFTCAHLVTNRGISHKQMVKGQLQNQTVKLSQVVKTKGQVFNQIKTEERNMCSLDTSGQRDGKGTCKKQL